jgi:mitochondrial pyruvate carrier 2
MAHFFKQAKEAFFHPSYGWKSTHFWGPVANWGIVLAGVYDMNQKGPDVISIPMTTTLCGYSAIFMRFAWQVQPRNYLLFACHLFNESVQLTQLARRVKYDQEIAASADLQTANNNNTKKAGGIDLTTVAAGFGVAGLAGVIGPKFQPQIVGWSGWPSSLRSLLSHPVGPFTIFFWAPIMKWGLSIANIIDYKRPVDNLSIPQQVSLALTGAIWTRYSFVITPVNYNLALVNFALMLTGVYQLTRKLIFDPFAIENRTSTD